MAERKIQRKLDDAIEELKENKFKYVPREDKAIDWAAYDEAQLNELDDQLTLIRELVEEAAGQVEALIPKAVGRPPKPVAGKAKAILTQQYFQMSNRVAAGLVWFLREKLDIHERLSYKSIERAYEDPFVILTLKLVADLTNEPLAGKEHDFSIDGTGLPRSMKQNWVNDKGDTEKRKGYDMLMGMIGTTYKMFSAAETAEGTANESPFFQPLLAHTAELYDSINFVCADSAYLSRDNCDAVGALGGVPRIYPKRGITITKKGTREWVHMLLALIEDPQKWLEEYHVRSISETGNSTLKRKFTRPLARRIDLRRKAEAFTRICNYNIRQLAYLQYLFDIEVRWFRGG